jgi:hypothetical protein
LSIGKSKFYVVSVHGLLFIARTDLNVKDIAVKRELQELQDTFFKAFPPERYSEKWEEMTNISASLDASYDRFFKESDQKMREAIW